MTASHEGTRQIGLAVAATTFSIVAYSFRLRHVRSGGQWFSHSLSQSRLGAVSLFVSFSLDPCCRRTADRRWEAASIVIDRPHAREVQPLFNDGTRTRADCLGARSPGWRWFCLRCLLVIALALPAVGLVARASSEPRISRGQRRYRDPRGRNLAYTRIKAEEAARMARTHKNHLSLYGRLVKYGRRERGTSTSRY